MSFVRSVYVLYLQGNSMNQWEFIYTLGSSIKCVRKMFRKTNVSNPLISTRTCAYQGVRNDNFSDNFAYVPNV